MLRKYVLLVVLLLLAACGGGGGNKSEAPRIQGTVDFIDRINKAEYLLRTRTTYYQYVQTHVRYIIQVSDRSRVTPSGSFYVAPPTYNSSTTWLASVLVHEARHVERGDVTSTVAAEKDAIKYQMVTLIQLKAPAHEIEHLKKQDGTHAYNEGSW